MTNSIKHNFLAILGRQPELGLVELEALIGASGVEPFGRSAALVSESLDVDRLGGSIKVGEVLYRGPLTKFGDLPIELDWLPAAGDSKTIFALSAYGVRATPRDLLAKGLTLKKRLRERGPVRLVVPGAGLATSAAELRHNRVLEHGFELLLVFSQSEVVIARTTGVQDIDWYSKRDYERPARSAKVGMLPPKLAQVLVNVTRGEVVVDPFCGTGVVLQEALLLGREVHGSDLAAEMVAASQTNLAWLGEQVAGLPAWTVEEANAREVKLPPNAAVVSEGYLGPNLHHVPLPDVLHQIRSDLRELYVATLKNWAAQLPAGAEVSLCVPAWRVGAKWSYLELVDELPKLGYTLKGFMCVQSPLLYSRDDQTVGRQLLLLRKI